MEFKYLWLIYNLAVLLLVAFLIHKLSWIGLFGLFALTDYRSEEKNTNNKLD